MKIGVVLLIAFFINIASCQAQNDSNKSFNPYSHMPFWKRWVNEFWDKQPLQTIETGTAWQKAFFLEIGLMRTGDVNGEQGESDGVLYGCKLAYTITPFLKNKIQAREASAEINIFFITVRTNMMYYISRYDNITHTDLRFDPEDWNNTIRSYYILLRLEHSIDSWKS